MGQAKQRKAEIEAIKLRGTLTVDLTKVEYENIIDIRSWVKSITGADDKVLDLMYELTGSQPEVVKCLDRAHRIRKCHENAPLLADELGGETVKGWTMFVYTDKEASDNPIAKSSAKYGIQEFNQHMIVRTPDGKLYDSTPPSSVGHGDIFRIFWQDDKLMTKDSIHNSIRPNGEYGWGENLIYLPENSKGYLERKEAADIQHITPGQLCLLSTEQYRTGGPGVSPEIEHMMRMFPNAKFINVAAL